MNRALVQWGRRAGAALAVAFLTVVLFGSSVSAHALLVSSIPPANAVVPSPPMEVRLVFSEPLEPRYSRAEIYDSNGNRVQALSRIGDSPNELIVPLPDIMSAGTYTVEWSNVSAADGHPQAGYVPFTIGSGVSPTAAVVTPKPKENVTADRLDTVGRWLGLLGIITAAGAVIAWLFVIRPALLPLPFEAAERVAGRLQLLALGGVAFALLGSLVLVLGQTSAAAGTIDLTSLADVVRATHFGRVWTARVILLVLFAVVLAIRELWAGDARRLRLLALIVAGGAAVPYALGSHAAAQAAGKQGAVAADWLHIVAASAWVGGLIALLAGLILARAIPAGQRREVYASAVVRFSTLAISSVVVLALTGLYAAWLHVGSLGALRDTRYGHTLALKLALLVPLLALGALNLRVLGPRLRGRSGAAPHFARTVLAEVVLGIAIVLVTGVLTGTPTARDTAALGRDHPVFTFKQDGMYVTLDIAPGIAGPNRYSAEVRPSSGALPAGTEVLLRFSNVRQSAAVREVTLTRPDPGTGHFEASGSDLSVAGSWRVEVLVRRPNTVDWRVQTPLELGSTTPAVTPPARPMTFEGWIAAGLMLMIALSVVLLVVGLRTRAGGEARRFVMEAGVALLVIGAVVLPLTRGGGQVAAVGPPPPTTESIARGQVTYARECATCHGATGHGDGPEAVSLNPPPVDLTVHVNDHPDDQLFAWIANGIPNSAMPAFKGQLSENEIWDLINFLHTLAVPGGSATPAPAHPATSSATPAATPAATPSASPTASAAPAGWVEVGRWTGSDAAATPDFTVRGPWRIRWRLDSAAQPFTVMIEPQGQTPRIESGPPGATTGALDEPEGGTYSLMLHNTTPYEVSVEEWRGAGTPAP